MKGVREVADAHSGAPADDHRDHVEATADVAEPARLQVELGKLGEAPRANSFYMNKGINDDEET